MTNKELIRTLREYADWADGNEWEVPLMLADHLRQAAERLEQMPRWIPAKEQLPELQSWGDSEVVLGLIKSENAPSLHNLTLCVYCDNGIWSMPGRYVAITHWMPLPKAPEVE